jgi:hypothetical protein
VKDLSDHEPRRSAIADRPHTRPIPVSPSQNGKQGNLNIEESKPVEIPKPEKASVGRTLLSDAFDVDLDLAEDKQDACSTVEERRFSAA